MPMSEQDRLAMTHLGTATESAGGGGSLGSGPATARDADGNTFVFNPDTQGWQMRTPIAGGALGEAFVGAGARINEYWQGIQNMGEGVADKAARLEQMAADRQAAWPMEATSAAYRTAGPMAADLAVGLATPLKGMLPGAIAAAVQGYIPLRDDQVMSAGIGAATALGSNMAMRTARGVWSMSDEAVSRMAGVESGRLTQGAKTVERFGGQVPPSQRAGGSALLQRTEAGWARQPWSAGPSVGQAEHNAALMNRVAARAIGEDAATVGTDVLESATENIGKRFDDVLEGVQVPATPELLQEITDTVGNRRSWVRLSDEIAANDYVMTGDQAKKIRRMLSDYTKTSDPIQKGYAMDAVEAFDDALGQSNLDQDAFRVAREQYKNLMLMESPGAVDDLGNVNPRQLLGRVSAKSGYGAGAGKANQTQNLLPETREMIELSRGLTQIQNNIPRTGELPGTADLTMLRSPGAMANAALARLYYNKPGFAPMLDQILRTTPTEEAINVAIRSQGGGSITDILEQ